MEMLNRSYYKSIWDKYLTVEALPATFSNNIALLSFKMILDRWRSSQAIHINFQTKGIDLNEIAKPLFIELSNEIFCNAADFPPLNSGDKVRSKKKWKGGKNVDFVLRTLPNGKFSLYNSKLELTIEKTFDDLVQQFIPLSQNTHNKTLTKFISFFEGLNGKQIHDFSPTFFERKFAFIAPKAIWDNLEDKNKVPSCYIPSSREETVIQEERIINEIKSIPALPDNIMYFVPKYEVCYQKLLLKGKRIKTVVVIDTEEDKVQQMLQDKERFGFNLIFITNSFRPNKVAQVPCWNWFKEECEIINNL